MKCCEYRPWLAIYPTGLDYLRSKLIKIRTDNFKYFKHSLTLILILLLASNTSNSSRLLKVKTYQIRSDNFKCYQHSLILIPHSWNMTMSAIFIVTSSGSVL